MTLPDRVTVLTCIGCGAMGREERCDGACSKHKLVLVSAVDYEDARAAAVTARAGEWQRNLDAFQAQARMALTSVT